MFNVLRNDSIVNVGDSAAVYETTSTFKWRAQALFPQPPWQAVKGKRPSRAFCLSQRTDRILQHCVLALIVVLGAEIFDLRLRQIQLRLRQFHDR